MYLVQLQQNKHLVRSKQITINTTQLEEMPKQVVGASKMISFYYAHRVGACLQRAFHTGKVEIYIATSLSEGRFLSSNHGKQSLHVFNTPSVEQTKNAQ